MGDSWNFCDRYTHTTEGLSHVRESVMEVNMYIHLLACVQLGTKCSYVN